MTSFSDLPEEMMIEVLSWLPAKSVGRSRLVSKPWRALLSKPKFMRTHLLHHSRNLGSERIIFISGDDHSLCYASLSSLHYSRGEYTLTARKLCFDHHPDSWNRVYTSCDGLLLVEDQKKRNKFVLNPTTQEIREVPPLPFDQSPLGNFVSYGLGYDSVRDDYKIATLSFHETGMFINVYSLESGSWERIESPPYDHVINYVISGVSVYGCIHWLCHCEGDYASIVAFDLTEGMFREVSLPNSVENKVFLPGRLAVLNGFLCICDETRSVWVMKEYGVVESWSMFPVDDPEGLTRFWYAFGGYDPEELGGGDSEVNVIWPMCMRGQDELIHYEARRGLTIYNLNGRSSIDIAAVGILHLDPQVSIVESIVSPNGARERERE